MQILPYTSQIADSSIAGRNSIVSDRPKSLQVTEVPELPWTVRMAICPICTHSSDKSKRQARQNYRPCYSAWHCGKCKVQALANK